jgi:hypothetical protein
VKIPETQPLLGDSRQCLASAAHKGLTEVILAVMVQLEAVLVDPLRLPSQAPIWESLDQSSRGAPVVL